MRAGGSRPRPAPLVLSAKNAGDGGGASGRAGRPRHSTLPGGIEALSKGGRGHPRAPSSTGTPAPQEPLVERQGVAGGGRPGEAAFYDSSPLEPQPASPSGNFERAADRRRQRRRVAGRDDPAVDAVPHLVRQPPGVRDHARAAVRHRLERDQRAAFVERRMDEQVGRFVPGVQIAIGEAAGEQGVALRCRSSAIAALRAAARNGPSPTMTQRQRPRASRPECSRSAAERLRRAGESPCSLRAGRHSAGRLRRRRCRPPPRTRAPSAASASASTSARSSAFGMVAIFSSGDAQVLADGRLERAVGRDHRVRRGARSDAPRAAAGRYAARFSVGARRIGRAELFEPLRIQHQRRRSDATPPRVAEHAGAEAVDDVRLAALDQLGRQPRRRACRTADTRCSDRSPSSLAVRRKGTCGRARTASCTSGSIGVAARRLVRRARDQRDVRRRFAARWRARS